MEGGWREDGGRERWKEGLDGGRCKSRCVCSCTSLQHTCSSCSPDCIDDHQFAQVQNIRENDLFVTSEEEKKQPCIPHCHRGATLQQ